MAVEFIDHKELQEKLAKDAPTIVNVFAEWCGPCKMLAPFLEELSKDHKVLKIDADKNSEFLKEAGIQGIPVTFIYKNGKPVQKFEGFVSKEQIEAAL